MLISLMMVVVGGLYTMSEGIVKLGNRKTYQITKIKNTGVVFEKTCMAQFYTKFYNIYTTLNIPQYHGELEKANNYLDELNEICENLINELHEKTKCRQRIQQERRMMGELRTKNNNFNNLLEHHERTKRGLVNGLGSILKYVGGVVDASDEIRIDQKLTDLDASQTGLLEIQKDQLYVVNSMRKNVDANMEQLFKEQNLTRKNLNELINEYRTQHQLSTRVGQELRLNEMLTILNMELLEMSRHRDETISIISSLQLGKLHPTLVSKEALKEIYHKIEGQINMGNNSPRKLRLSRSFEVNSQLVRRNLVINIKAPIPEATAYEINKLYLLPIRRNLREPALVYDIKNAFIASDVAKTKFIRLTEAEYKDCTDIGDTKEPKIILCKLTQAEMADNKGTCDIKLLQNRKPRNGTCGLRIVNTSQIFSRMSNGNKFLFSLQGKKSIKILGKNGLFVDDLEGTGILELLNWVQIHIDNQIYRATSSVETNFTIEVPEDDSILNVFDMTRDVDLTRRLEPVVEEHHVAGIKLGSGERMEHWKLHIQNLEEQRKSAIRNKIGHGISGTLWTTCGLILTICLIIKRRRANLRKIAKPIQQMATARDMAVELQEDPCHRSAARLNH